jgi:hypothetical protein
MNKRNRIASLALCALLGALMATAASLPARSATWFEMNFGLIGPRYHGMLPACDNPFVLAKIDFRFWAKEIRFWDPRLRISRFGETREVAYRPWGNDASPRRFCQARTLMSDGTETVTNYSIIEDQSFAGAIWGVEWCVQGYDRNMAYSPRCKMALP